MAPLSRSGKPTISRGYPGNSRRARIFILCSLFTPLRRFTAMARDKHTMSSTSDDQVAALLALCARARSHPAQMQRLAHLARSLHDWDGLPVQAEAHGLVPLLYTHLRAAGIELPLVVRQPLLGYYMQHAHAARVREQALVDIL